MEFLFFCYEQKFLNRPYIQYYSLHCLSCGKGAQHERHHRRRHCRSRQRHFATLSRTIHLTHEYRLIERVARAVVHAQRRRVRAPRHAAPKSHEKYIKYGQQGP